jgi:hypothetical protein
MTHAASSLADAPPGRYGVSAGIVKDNRTGLSWQQNVDAGSYSWANAKTYCQSLTLNASGWRLPTYKELLTLIDPTRASPNPLIDANAFPSTPADSFWTASPYVGAAGHAWFVNFGVGGPSNDSDASILHRVRCVR